MSSSLLYVGGLAPEVNEKILHGAFIPFGPIVDVTIPREASSQKHRGFGFVEFEEKTDAAAAIDNMHDSELYGRVIKVNAAKPIAEKIKPIWEQMDEYYKNVVQAAQKEEGAENEVAAEDEDDMIIVSKPLPSGLMGQLGSKQTESMDTS